MEYKENLENVELKRKELYRKIKQCRTKYYKEIFKYLSDLLRLERNINVKYTMMQLAIDTDLSTSFVYRVLSWRYATPYAKKVVRDNEIGMSKVCRIISKISLPVKQDEAVKYVIKHKLTDNEIDLYVNEGEVKEHQLKTERTTKSEWNIERNIITGCSRLRRNLLSAHLIPLSQKNEVIKKLTELNKNIIKTLKVLRK